MSLFRRNKGDTDMSRKKQRDGADQTEQAQETFSEDTSARAENDVIDEFGRVQGDPRRVIEDPSLTEGQEPQSDELSAAERESATRGSGPGSETLSSDNSDRGALDVQDRFGRVGLAPRRDDETEEAYKARQVAYAQAELTAAEKATSALYSRKDGESEAEYQARIDELMVRGPQPGPQDAAYQLPEAPTLGDQRDYLVHYNLATEEEAKELSAEEIAVLMSTHAADLASRREQAAMRSDVTDLPVNPSIAQLRSYVTSKGLVRAELVETMELAALQALVIAPPAAPPTIDLSAPQAEVSDVPFGGDPPRYYVVLEGRTLYLEGVSVSLKETQIINDRSHDIAQLKKLGVRMVETVDPVTAGSV